MFESGTQKKHYIIPAENPHSEGELHCDDHIRNLIVPVRMMQPARVKTAKTIAMHSLFFRYTESGK